MEDRNRKKKAGREAAALLIAIALAIAFSFALCKIAVGAANPWVVGGLGGASAVVGAVGGGSLVDAVIISLILAGITAVAFASLSVAPFWGQVLLSLCTGLCTGQLLLGAYADFAR